MTGHDPSCSCAQCGKEIPSPPLDFAYRLPDCVFAQPAAERSPRCNEDFAELGSRRFVRALLPVPLEGGEEFRFGIWIEVEPTTFEAVIRAWNDPDRYRTLAFEGALANAIAPYGPGALDAVVDLRTRDERSRPFVTAARDAWLRGLLANGWTQAEWRQIAEAWR